jgi:ribosomal protein L11 methyltransferase
MEWIKIKVNTSKPGIDFVSGIFEGCGVLSLEIEDNEEFLEVLEQTRPQWDFVEDGLYQEKIKACTVSAYLANNDSGKALLRLIESKINQARLEDINKRYGSLEILIAVLNEEDWAENWKKYFKPIPVGENILICPEWEDVPEEYKSRVVFKIDPGMSFGTGSHETSRLCAAAL